MQTDFNLAQLANSDTKDADSILRKCVHCGLCAATCPTFVMLGDELDSPRGRIYLIREMLQSGKIGSKAVKHVDRCLSCLSCMTTCPSGVDYMHLVDHARNLIERYHMRNLSNRVLRQLLMITLPYPKVFRFSLTFGRVFKPLAKYLPGPLATLLRMIPNSLPSTSSLSQAGTVHRAEGKLLKRVVLMTGCAQQVLRPSINDATIRLLTRFGCEVFLPHFSGCCGALAHHMGRGETAADAAKSNIKAWEEIKKKNGLDNIIINTSGCGTMVKDYGWILKNDHVWSESAASMVKITRDISQFLSEINISGFQSGKKPEIVYHSACSMTHGQKIITEPLKLLRDAGFRVSEPGERHLCCGSAGTYNILHQKMAKTLLRNKVKNIEKVSPDFISTGNIGCMTQISNGTKIPIIHTVELLDWFTGGPKPQKLKNL